ncbi:MAG: ABC transporter permease [Acidobacteriota bacterium]|nr:ABC transporter permease [Acidobacteriota bacterium]
MRKIWLVIKREYKTRVVSKGFVISTIAIPALFGGMILFEILLAGGHPSKPFKIAVLEGAGGVSRQVLKNLSKIRLPGGQPEFDVQTIAGIPSEPVAARARLDELTRSHALDGYLFIPAGVAGGAAEPELVENNEAILQSKDTLSRAVNSAVFASRLKSYGVDPARAGSLLDPVDLRVTRLTQQGKSEDKGQGYIIAIVMATILYGALLMYGITTMRSVLEEKSTRTMEVLISSARPVDLMAGKILGVAAVGLTQFLIWAVSAALIAGYGLAMAHAFGPGKTALNIHIPASLLAAFVIYFIGGYFLYASMYAVIGAVVSDQNDAHQLQTPVTFTLVASFILFGVVSRDPNSTTAFVLTMIPFFSPILMVFRIALETPPLWQIALSMAILAITILGVVYASARIYRVGVLMYGKRPSLVEIFKWMRYS